MIIWLAFIKFVSGPLGQGVVITLGVVALFFTWLALHDAKVADGANAKIVTSLNKAAEKKADEAVKARAPAMRTGAAARLRDATNCRDCN